MEVKSGLRYKNHIRITSESYVRLTLGKSVIKPWKWDQKFMYQICLEVMSGLCYKNHVRITSESYVRLTLGSFVTKPCKWNQKVTQ